MTKETKFNYGLLFVGLALPILAEYFLGRACGVIVAIVVLVVGGILLVSGHTHSEQGMPVSRKKKLAAYAFVGALLSLGIMGIRVVYSREFAPQSAGTQVSTMPQTGTDHSAAVAKNPQTASSIPSPTHKTRARKSSLSTQPTQSPPINSLIENAGKLRDTEISGSDVTAPQNGAATLLHNLPTGDVSGTKIANSHVLSTPVTSPKNDDPNKAAPGILLNDTNKNTISGNYFCGATAIKTTGSDSGNVFSDNHVNEPAHCAWLAFLASATEHQRKGDLPIFMENWKSLMKQSWKSLPEATQASNCAELDVIEKQLLSTANDRFEFLRTIVSLGETLPNFEVRLP
ncbi:MAG: hypothetical protein ABSA54_18475 [Terriglobales bacterium]|jgi:hypothetical protein